MYSAGQWSSNFAIQLLYSATKCALSEMYRVACKFASEYSMVFNVKKSKLMLFDTYEAY